MFNQEESDIIDWPKYAKDMLPLSDHVRKVFSYSIPAMKGWRTTIDHTTQNRQLRRYLEECNDLIEPREVLMVKTSKPYLDSKKAMASAAAGEKLADQEMFLTRNRIIIKFALATGTRPGVLNNAESGRCWWSASVETPTPSEFPMTKKLY